MTDDPDFPYGDLFAPVFSEAFNDFLAQTTPEMFFPGGRCSTKSSFVSILVVAGVLANPGANAIVFRKHQTDIKDSVYNQVMWAIEKLGMSNRFYFMLSPAKMIVKATGQGIYFYGLDDPKKRKSIKPPSGYFRYMWMEELDQFAGMAEVRSVRQSVFRGGPFYQSLYTFNPPPSVSNWVNAETARIVPGRKVYRSDYRDILAHNREWVSEGFVEEAERTRQSNEMIYRHEYLGEPTGTGGEIFTNVVQRDFDVEDLKASGKCEWSWGQDFGFTNHPSVTAGTSYDPNEKTLYVWAEYPHFGPKLDEIIAWCKARGLEETDIVADRAGDLAIAEMISKGLNRVRKCWKSPDGWRDDGIRWMRTRTRIVVHVNCPYAYQELTHYEFGRYANGDFKTEYPKEADDAIDAIRYSAEAWIKRDQMKRYVAMPQGFVRRTLGMRAS